MSYESAKKRVFRILELAALEDRLSKFCDILLLAFIALNVVSVILETVPSLARQYEVFFSRFETISVVVFSLEYLLRLWTCTTDRRYRGRFRGRLRFMLTPLALVDLLAILPFYLPMVMDLDLRLVRILRFIRLFRLLKMSRYLRSIRLFGVIIQEKKEELILAMGMVAVILLFAASGMYLLESGTQPDAFSSIPAAMWWGIATLTTVGYGDIYPVTPFGKVLGSVIALLGVGLFALPAGILASGFSEALQRQKGVASQTLCPHCGEAIDDPARK